MAISSREYTYGINVFSGKRGSFGGIGRSIKANDHHGKKFKLTGYARLSPGSQGTGHLWVREDTKRNGMGFFNNMDDRPITSSEWTKYEIEGRLGDFSDRLVFGAFLKGRGSFKLDDIHLYIETDSQWEDVPLENNSFEGKDWARNGWEKMGEKYDQFTDDVDKFDGQYSLVIKYTGNENRKIQKPIFEEAPSMEEPWITALGSGVWINMPLVLFTDKDHTFPVATEDIVAYMDQAEKDTPTDAASLAFRLGNIINAWNVFQHFYPYFDEVGANWDMVLHDQLLRTFSSNKETHIDDLKTLTAPLKDGHINVSGPSSSYFSPPILWEWVENELVITEVYDEKLGLNRGDVVEAINGHEPNDYFDQFRGKISAPTKGWLDYRANSETLFGEEGSEMDIDVNGRKYQLIRDVDHYQHRTNQRKSLPPYRFMDGGIIYINLDVAPMDTIDAIMPQLEKCTGIIADLRGYPVGDNHMLINYLLKKSDKSKWMHVDQVIYPDRVNPAGQSSQGWQMSPQKPYLGDRKVVFIIDGQAISYAESYMGFVEANDLATIIGQPTAGTNGSFNAFTLPGGYKITFTGMHVVKHDGSQHHGIGVLPDIYVEKTIAGVKAGRDEFLEKAIQLLTK